jgi:pilus assembly protein Flp/PilA
VARVPNVKQALPSARHGAVEEREKVVKNLVSKFRRNDEGASAVEYGLLVALIAVVIAGAVAFLGNALNSKIENACTQVAGNGAGAPACAAP